MLRRPWIASLSFAAALGCGAHLHRPQDASTAESAAGELKAARLTEGFTEELAQSKQMLTEELAAAKTAAEVGRDRDLLDILSATGEADPETEAMYFPRCRGRFKGDGWTTLCHKISARLFALTGHVFAAPTAAPSPLRRDDGGPTDPADYLRRRRDLQRRFRGPNSDESQLGRAVDEYAVAARALRLSPGASPPARCPLLDLPGRSPLLQGHADRLRGQCRARRDNLRAVVERAVCRGPGCGPAEIGLHVERTIAVHDAVTAHHDELVRRVYAYAAAKHPCSTRGPDLTSRPGAPGQPPASAPPATTPPATTPPAGATPPASTPPAATPPATSPPASRPASGATASRGASPMFLSFAAGPLGQGPLAMSPGAGLLAQAGAPAPAPASTVTVRAAEGPATCDEAVLRARLVALGELSVSAALTSADLAPLGRLGRLYQLDEQIGAVEALIEELQLAARRPREPELDPALVATAPRFARVLQETIEGIERIHAAIKDFDQGVLALLRETLRVERTALAEAQAYAERRVRLDRVKLAAQLDEAALLTEALVALHKLELAGCTKQGLVAAHEAKACRDDLTRGLVAFGNAWTVGRAAQRQTDVLDLGTRHDASLARSRAAMAVREVYLVAGVAELVKYNKGGLAPEALAQIIVQAVGFAVVAGGVYTP